MKKSIAFVTSGLDFNGDTLKTKALGGSESAMIYMARELAKLNNEVTVYCECDKPGIYDNVDYRHCHTFMEDNKSQFDVCIISRFTHFLAKPIDSKLNMLWIHDTGIHDPEIAMSRIDNVFCLSEFQRKGFETRYNLKTDHFWITTNGFDPDLVPKRVPFEQKKNNYIYSSRYERGIIKLLEEIWPKILDKNPKATLNLCGYDNKATFESKDEYLLNYYKRANELIGSYDSIYNHGCLSKTDYYKLLTNCAYMVYPSDFPEISCISAIEAQACGCLVLTSNASALAETVKSNTKIDINEHFNDNYLALLDKYVDKVYEAEVDKVLEKIQEYDWLKIAKSWNNKLDNLFIERSTKYRDKIINQLVYCSDIVAVTKLSDDEKYKQLLERSISDNANIDKTYNPLVDAWENSRIKEVISIIRNSILELNYSIKILDLGSHDGGVSRIILDNFHFFIEKLYAYDSCDKALTYYKDNFKSKYKQLEFIHDDVLNIEKYKDLDINFIFVGELLEHIKDTVDFLTKLVSIVNQKTIICFTTPAGPWDNVDKIKFAVEHMHHFELNDIKKIFQEVDLKIVRPKETMMGRHGEPLYHWIYYFTINPEEHPKFHYPDYMDKFIKTRPYKSISGSMIVKNEENNLARCIKSFYDIVDELIIVDTGSTDSTLEIAAKYTDKIYHYKWEEEDGLGDFSKARNYALSKCSGDYVLWMDADEELINPQVLVRHIFSDYYDSILIKQRSCIVYGDPSEHDDPYPDRLFKREGASFTGVVHEYVTYGNNWVSKALFQDISFIVHYGTINKPKRQDRIKGRYFDLIVKNYNKYPDRLMAQYYYMGLMATIVKEMGDLSKLPEVFEIWNKKLVPSGDLWLLKKSLNFIQDMYVALYHNNIILPFGALEYREFENELGNKIRLIATSDAEFELFLKIISNQSLNEYKTLIQYRF
jgi:glycosyltransferase involved in cell wall biosynthesis